MFYVYVDKTDDGRVFYVGKAVLRRLQQKKRNKKHTRVAREHGCTREVVWETDDEQAALAYEIKLIEFFGTFTSDWREGIECNFTVGGDGIVGAKRVYGPLSDEHKVKIAERLRGVKKTAEHRQKVIDAVTGSRRSDETRQKLSESHRGIRLSLEARAKVAASLKEQWGKRRQDERAPFRALRYVPCRVHHDIARNYFARLQGRAFDSPLGWRQPVCWCSNGCFESR